MREEESIFEVDHICVEVGDFSLKDISFVLRKGYITGLVGANGSGKSTLIKAIANEYSIKAGTITMDGYDHVYQKRLFADGIGYVTADLHYFQDSMNIWDHLDVIKPLYEQFDEPLFLHYLEKYHIITRDTPEWKKKNEKPIAKYSYGQQMRIITAFALAHHPKVLLLDEPTANLDPVFCREYLDDLQTLINEEEVAVLFCTHLTEELDQIADYLIVMENGSILLQEEKEVLLEKYGVRNVKELLLAATKKREEMAEYKQKVAGITQKKAQKKEARRYLKQREQELSKKGIAAGDAAQKFQEAAAVLKKKNRFSNVICAGYYLAMLGVILVQIASFMMSKGQSAKGGWWILIFFGTMFVDTYTAAFETKGVDSFETLFPYIPVSKRDYDKVRKQHRRKALYYIAPLAMFYFAILIYGMIRWHDVAFRFYVLVVIAGIVLLELFGPARPVR